MKFNEAVDKYLSEDELIIEGKIWNWIKKKSKTLIKKFDISKTQWAVIEQLIKMSPTVSVITLEMIQQAGQFVGYELNPNEVEHIAHLAMDIVHLGQAVV